MERPHCRLSLLLFLSTLSLRRATPCHGRVHQGRNYFYPRSPCGERLLVIALNKLNCLFLSTLSLRRATSPCYQKIPPQHYFYPRSPCGERLSANNQYICKIGISIHALLAESDAGCLQSVQLIIVFLSTLSLRRATIMHMRQSTVTEFLSTLSLRRATWPCRQLLQSHVYFYPRSPCGERPSPAI